MASTSHAKQIPFNVSLPWGQSAAAQLGISEAELKANYKNDHRLHDEIQSACSMIRDYSIKELTKANLSAAKTLKDICYGTGYTLVEGHMVQSGACRQGVKTPKPQPMNKDSTDTAGYGQACLKKEGDIFVNYDRRTTNPFVAKTWPERVEAKDMIGTFTPGKAASFLQLKNVNSNLEIPGYSDPTLNGKGYSYNSLPHERYDDNSDQFLYKNNAYNVGQHSVQPTSVTQKGLELAKKLQEENKAIGTDLGEDSLIKTDMRQFYVRLDNLPDWICSTICAGLNLDEIVENEGMDQPMDFNEVEGNLFKTEEEQQLHMGRKGQDKRLERPVETLGQYKQQNGEQLCETIPPSIDDCIDKGLELSTWFTERILNPLVMCNWKTNSCGSLFGEAGAGGKKPEGGEDKKPEGGEDKKPEGEAPAA